ncbi:hypothetical protein BS17DRAFT_830692 [Gyrodon lividus]|nr:hypothetical protein BS17DRAFT_830692 [Gyrodon lividus]
MSAGRELLNKDGPPVQASTVTSPDRATTSCKRRPSTAPSPCFGIKSLSNIPIREYDVFLKCCPAGRDFSRTPRSLQLVIHKNPHNPPAVGEKLHPSCALVGKEGRDDLDEGLSKETTASSNHPLLHYLYCETALIRAKKTVPAHRTGVYYSTTRRHAAFTRSSESARRKPDHLGDLVTRLRKQYEERSSTWKLKIYMTLKTSTVQWGGLGPPVDVGYSEESGVIRVWVPVF